MAGHIAADFCSKPNRFTHRIGSVWQCNCGAVWSLQKEGPYGTTRTWTKVLIRQETEGLKLGRRRR